MSDSLPQPPPVSEPITYRPISAFAVAGLTASGVCAGLVLIATVVALYQGTPFYYPLWLVLGPALAGFVISVLARNQIRGSEGTQAGDRLAVAGIWLSVLFGLGYCVYVYVSGLAVTSQANAFMTELGPESGFLPHLVKAGQSQVEFNTAFLLTQPAANRGNVRPDDEAGMRRTFDTGREGGPGALSAFRKHHLVRLVATAPPGTVQFEPMGVQGWEYEARSYKVARAYKIITPEAELEVTLPAASTEGETAGEPRRWYMQLQRVPRPTARQLHLTPLGHGLQFIRAQTNTFLLQWQADLNRGQPFAFREVDGTQWERLPGSESQRGYVQARLQDLFASDTPRRLLGFSFTFMDEAGLGDWHITEDKKVQLTHSFRFTLEPLGSQEPTSVEGDVVVETRDPVDPLALSASQDIPCVIRKMVITRFGTATRKDKT